MAKIHWLVYIAVGLFVSIASWKIDKERFVFFFYAGLAFVFVGIVKLIFNLVKNRTSKKAKQKIQPQGNSVKHCHQCGNAASPHHKFCVKCGARI